MMREIADMTARPLFFLSRTILIFSLIVLSACGGDGGVSKPVSVPVPLTTVMTVGAPRTDTVFFGGFNDYSVSVMPGALYKISITGLTDDADLLFFGTDSTFGFLASCAVDNTIIADVIGQPLTPEDCIVSAPGNVLFFSVDGTFLSTSSADYTIDVERLTPSTNLTLSIPSPDVTTRTNAVAYAVTVTPGVSYTISITGLTDDADLFVFGNDGTFSSLAVCSIDNTRFIGTTPEDCTLTSAGGAFYFIVDGIFSTAPTVTYTALVTPAPPIINNVNEGSIATPVNVSADTPSFGQVGPAGTSYYVATGLTPNTRYTVSITGLTANANLTVYGSNNTFETPVACLSNRDNTFFADTTPEDCTVFVSGSTLYFAVSAGSGNVSGAGFINLIEIGP
jgi:hypothetical protein